MTNSDKKISSDVIIERTQLKRQLTLWRVLSVLVIVVVLVSFFERKQQDKAAFDKDYIARVRVDGIITDNAKLDALFKSLQENSRVKAIIVYFNSPGGDAVGGEMLYRRLNSVSAKKPVVALMRSVCASACYMGALGASNMLAMNGTITGSIGVLLQAAEFTKMADKLGITPITIKSGENKAAPLPTESFTVSQRALIQGVIDDYYQVFLEMVAKSRKMDKAKVLQLAQGGRIYSARQALAVKLIDGIGGEEEALAWLQKQKKLSADLTVRDEKVKKEKRRLLDEFELDSMAKNFIGEVVGLPLSFAENSANSGGLMLMWKPNR